LKRVYVNEKWCLGCHLCEYYCAFASANEKDMARALKDIKISPRIRIEEMNGISFAVSCRHCNDPLCVKGCITGALQKMTVLSQLTEINVSDAIPAYYAALTARYRHLRTEPYKNVSFV